MVQFDSFTETQGFAVVYRDWQKKLHRDADGTYLNRRAVMVNS
jgi:hypothetical protein